MEVEIELSSIKKTLNVQKSDHLEASPDTALSNAGQVVDGEAQDDLEDRNRRNALALPPIDRGRQAWTFVFCAFLLEMIVWGFPLSFGVLQEYFLTHPPFENSSEASINSIGTVAVAFQYIQMPFVIAFCQRHPRWVRTMTWSALFTCSGALLLSSFANKVWQLILLQGVMMGVGGSCLYAPIAVWLNEWFVDRRALATSLVYGGSGIGGAFFPFLINLLLNKTGGFRWTLRILSVIVCCCGGIALLGVKSRLPVAPTSNVSGVPGNTLNLSFVKSPLFIAMSLTTTAQSLAYFPVSLYIPSYTTSVGLSALSGTVALATFNLAGVIGQVVFGHLCDKTAYTRIMVFSGLGSSISAYLLLGFAHNLGLLFAFVIIFGSISGGFSSINPPASLDIVGTAGQPATVLGSIVAFKGIAIIIGPIISAALRQHGKKAAPAKYGGYGFTGITLFVGSMMAVTTAGGLLVTFLRTRKR